MDQLTLIFAVCMLFAPITSQDSDDFSKQLKSIILTRIQDGRPVKVQLEPSRLSFSQDVQCNTCGGGPFITQTYQNSTSIPPTAITATPAWTLGPTLAPWIQSGQNESFVPIPIIHINGQRVTSLRVDQQIAIPCDFPGTIIDATFRFWKQGVGYLPFAGAQYTITYSSDGDTTSRYIIINSKGQLVRSNITMNSTNNVYQSWSYQMTDPSTGLLSDTLLLSVYVYSCRIQIVNNFNYGSGTFTMCRGIPPGIRLTSLQYYVSSPYHPTAWWGNNNITVVIDDVPAADGGKGNGSTIAQKTTSNIPLTVNAPAVLSSSRLGTNATDQNIYISLNSTNTMFLQNVNSIFYQRSVYKPLPDLGLNQTIRISAAPAVSGTPILMGSLDVMVHITTVNCSTAQVINGIWD